MGALRIPFHLLQKQFSINHFLSLSSLKTDHRLSGHVLKLSLTDVVWRPSLLLAHNHTSLSRPAQSLVWASMSHSPQQGWAFVLGDDCLVEAAFIGFCPGLSHLPILYYCFLASPPKEIRCPPVLFSGLLRGNSNQNCVPPRSIKNHIVGAWWTANMRDLRWSSGRLATLGYKGG